MATWAFVLVSILLFVVIYIASLFFVFYTLGFLSFCFIWLYDEIFKTIHTQYGNHSFLAGCITVLTPIIGCFISLFAVRWLMPYIESWFLNK